MNKIKHLKKIKKNVRKIKKHLRVCTRLVIHWVPGADGQLMLSGDSGDTQVPLKLKISIIAFYVTEC